MLAPHLQDDSDEDSSLGYVPHPAVRVLCLC